MKAIARTITVLAAALVINALPALGDEGSMGRFVDPGQQVEKNECLLVALNCGNAVDSIQQRIDRIQKEIGRGTAVYTNEELGSLKEQLDDAIKTLDYALTSGGA